MTHDPRAVNNQLNVIAGLLSQPDANPFELQRMATEVGLTELSEGRHNPTEHESRELDGGVQEIQQFVNDAYDMKLLLGEMLLGGEGAKFQSAI